MCHEICYEAEVARVYSNAIGTKHRADFSHERGPGSFHSIRVQDRSYIIGGNPVDIKNTVEKLFIEKFGPKTNTATKPKVCLSTASFQNHHHSLVPIAVVQRAW